MLLQYNVNLMLNENTFFPQCDQVTEVDKSENPEKKNNNPIEESASRDKGNLLMKRLKHVKHRSNYLTVYFVSTQNLDCFFRN